jgi:hypothetical protein
MISVIDLSAVQPDLSNNDIIITWNVSGIDISANYPTDLSGFVINIPDAGVYYTNGGQTSYNENFTYFYIFNLSTSVISEVPSGIYYFQVYVSPNISNSGSDVIMMEYYYTNPNDDSGGTVDPPVCFNEGTKILCLNNNLEEEYIPIEHLKKGDLVKSYNHGYRKIDLISHSSMVNNPNVWNFCMYKMKKTEKNGLLEDFIVTGGHSILVDDLAEYKEKNDELFSCETPKIDDKYLLLSAVSKDFEKIENNKTYNYYHFILENNDNDEERFGIWANGILTETPSKKFFVNSHLYFCK